MTERRTSKRRDDLDPDELYREYETEEHRNEKAKAALSIRSEHTLRSENLPFDIDVQFTFASYFLPLTRQEARAIINMYQTSILRRQWLRPEDVDVLRNLERRLEELFVRHFKGKTAFMRLCGRSPKDADPLNPENVLHEFEEELERVTQEFPDLDPNSPNTKFVALTRVNWMKVTNAREVMNLLLTSERVNVDMDDWLRYGEPEQIVLREWEPDLTIDNEFRAFVYKNKLNGISQYDHYGVFPHLEAIKDKIQRKILALWEEVHPHIGEESYVVDFGYLPKSDIVKVIEISPFLTCTGAACFRWSNEDDVHTLKHGPLEFRLNSVSKVTAGLIEAGIYERFSPNPTRLRYWDYMEMIKPSSPPPFPYKSLLIPWLGISISTYLASLYADLSPSETAISAAILSLLYTVYTKAKHTSDFYGRIRDEVKKAKEDQEKSLTNLIFFYGTLKEGFHWNQKFLSSSRLVCTATTLDLFPLVVGDCGVPYLLGDHKGSGNYVLGEVWAVSNETLKSMDDYEGLRKGYYCREKIPVSPVFRISEFSQQNFPEVKLGGEVTAYVYFKVKSDESLLQLPFLEVYDYKLHKQLYKPIKHIQVKQRAYLGIEYDIGH